MMEKSRAARRDQSNEGVTGESPICHANFPAAAVSVPLGERLGHTKGM